MTNSEKQNSAQPSIEQQVREWVDQCGPLAEDLPDDFTWLQKLRDQNVEPLRTEQPNPTSLNNLIPASVGPYQLVSLIGEGGMGTVWCGLQQEPIKRKVAIKLIRAGMEHHLQRFNNERQSLALMNHPGIARLYDAGSTATGQPYFIMEYVDGQDLASFVNQHRIDLSGRLQLFLQTCEAIQYSHSQGIVHRDIKPSNILVTADADSPDWNVKVIDFGLAKSFSEKPEDQKTLTAEATVLGSLRWMSPEQARLAGTHGRREPTDERTDIFSLGAVLFQLLTGTTPIDDETCKTLTDWQLLERIQQFDPTKPSTRNRRNRKQLTLASSVTASPESTTAITLSSLGTLERELDWIVLKALQNDPCRRYASVAELADDVKRFVNHHPVTCRPPSAMYPIAKLIRRNQQAAWFGLALTICLALGLWFTFFYADKAGRARVQADAASTHAFSMSLEAKHAQQDADIVASRVTEVERDLEKLDALFLISLDRLHPIHEEFTSSKKDAPFLRELQHQLENEAVNGARQLPILNKLASIWFSYGQPDESRAILENALELHVRSADGQFSRTHAVARRLLGRAYLELNRLDEGFQFINSASEMMDCNLKFEDPDRLRSQTSLAIAYRRLGNKVKAIEICQNALHKLDLSEYPVDEHRLDFANLLALSLAEMGRPADAISICHATMRRSKQTPGLPADLVKIVCGHTQVRVFKLANRHLAAKPLCAEILLLSRNRYGKEHPRTLEIEKDYGICIFYLGQPQEGIECLENALQLSRRQLGDQHLLSFNIAADLGVLLSASNRQSEALEHLQFVWQGQTALRGESHPSTLRTMVNLGTVTAKLGNVDTSTAILTKAYDLAKTSYGMASTETFIAIKPYVTCCFALGDAAVGINALRDFVDHAIRHSGTHSQFAVGGKYELAHSLFLFGQVDECLTLVQELVELPESYIGPVRLRAAMLQCEAFLSIKAFEKLRLTLEDRRLMDLLGHPDNHAAVSQAQMFQAELLLHDENYDAAAELATLVLETKQDHSEICFRCRGILGFCLFLQGQENRGTKLLQESAQQIQKWSDGYRRNFWYLIPLAERLSICHEQIGDNARAQEWHQFQQNLKTRFLEFQQSNTSLSLEQAKTLGVLQQGP